MAKQRFLGLQYPLIKTARGTMAQKSGVDQIKADLLQLLLTNPGERVMLPAFGTPLRELMFEPNDPTLEIRARQIISDAILLWEPRVVVTDIEISSQADKDFLNPNDSYDEIEAILQIRIRFVDPQNITEIDELAIEVPLGG